MGTLLVSGCANLITYNYQNETTYVDKDKKTIYWRHPFFMGAFISFSQSMSLLVYAVKKRIFRTDNKSAVMEPKSPEFNAHLDVASSRYTDID